MSTAFATGVGEGEAEPAGRDAAEMALSDLGTDGADLAVVFCSSTYDPEPVVAGVRSVVGDAELIGSTATGEFTDRGVHTSVLADGVRSEGVTVALVASDEMQFFTGLGRDLTDGTAASVAAAAADLPTSVEGYPHRTGLLFWSSLLGAEEIAMHAYQEVPVEWAGGGAADAQFRDTAVFVDDETAVDGVAMALVASKSPTGVGVSQRHEPMGPGYEVTSADGNVVYELDGRPAYDVWRETFDEVASERFGVHTDDVADQPERLLPMFLEFSFGVRTGDDEYKMRSAAPTVLEGAFGDAATDASKIASVSPTPQQRRAGALSFFEPIPEGVVLYPMISSRSKTLARGEAGIREAQADIQSSVAGGLVFDCPCSEFVLGEEYGDHVARMTDAIDAPLAGFQPGNGELCMRHDDMRGMHESSTSVVLFPGGSEE